MNEPLCPTISAEPRVNSDNGTESAGVGHQLLHVAHAFDVPVVDRLRMPDDVRDDVADKLSILRRIHAATNKWAACQQLCAEHHGKRGYSAKRLKNLYHAYLASGGNWRVLVNKAKAPELRESFGLHPYRERQFLEWAHGFLLLNQREKFLPRYRKLLEHLQLWRATGSAKYALPGYDGAPTNAPGLNHPAGWSPSNLRRLCRGSKFEKRAIGVGRSAASSYRPQVLTTRVGMKVGQVYFFDDSEHDMKVRFLGNQGRVLRPLEFACLEYYSGCFVANVFKPTLYDEENEKRIKLRSAEFLWLAVHWLLDIGWREDTGTKLVAEHGTAKFPDWFQAKVTQLTGGKVTFEEGAVDRRAASDAFFKGPARGNFRTKSPLESMFNLVRNETSDLLLFPGQVGKERSYSPEELCAREAHEKQLAMAELVLSRDGVDRLRHDFLEWNQWICLAHEVYRKINQRGGPGLEWWQHDLEGWVEEGLVATEWRQPAANGYSEWLDHTALSTLTPGQQQAIRALLHVDGVNLTRNRKLSPLEVWARSSHELKRAPLCWLPLILPPEMGRPVRVDDQHMIQFEDNSLAADKLRFAAAGVTNERTGEPLRPGQEFTGWVNQFNPRAIYLCDTRGRGVAECAYWGRVSRDDVAGVAQKNREVRRMEAALLAPVARAGAELARTRADNAAYNAEVLQRFGGALATVEPRQREEDADLAALADAALMGNLKPNSTEEGR